MELETLSQVQFNRFREFIYKHSGNRVDESKILLMSNRIRRRLKAGSHSDYDAYYKFLNSAEGKEEMEHFLDTVTTNETHFYRTKNHFDWFSNEFVAEMIAQEKEGKRAKSIRVWSAASSTGEEPYTLALCLAENSSRLKDWKLNIVGTDISERVLKAAREGVYNERSIDEVPDLQLKKYFEVNDAQKTWKVRESVRKLVEFRWHNLMEPMRGTTSFDCVFIRNVLIYFDKESKQKVIKHLVAAMARGSYLVVGPSEGIYDMLDMLKKRSTYLYQKP